MDPVQLDNLSLISLVICQQSMENLFFISSHDPLAALRLSVCDRCLSHDTEELSCIIMFSSRQIADIH